MSAAQTLERRVEHAAAYIAELAPDGLGYIDIRYGRKQPKAGAVKPKAGAVKPNVDEFLPADDPEAIARPA